MAIGTAVRRLHLPGLNALASLLDHAQTRVTSSGSAAQVPGRRDTPRLRVLLSVDMLKGRYTRGRDFISIGLLLVAIILTIIYIGQAFMSVIPQDEGELFTYSWLMVHGAVPYRDIWMMYPPSTYIFIAALMKVGVPGLISERMLGFAVRLAYVIVVNRALGGSWRRVSWLAVFAVLGYVFLASTDMRAYPWIVAMPPAFAGIILIPRNPLWAAVLLSVAGAIRYEFALVGCGLFLVLVVYDLAVRSSVRRLLVGLLLLLGLSIAYYASLVRWAGSVALQDIFVDPIKYIGPTQHSPLFPPTFGWLFLPVELSVIVGPAVLIVLALRLRNRMALIAGAGAYAFLPHFLNTADVTHLFNVACISVPLLLSGTLALPRTPAWRVRILSVGVLVPAVWTTLIVLAYGVYLSPLSPLSPQPVTTLTSRLVVSSRGPVIDSTPSEARDTRAVLDFLGRHAHPGQRLFVSPRSIQSTYTMTDLYYLAGLHPATPYLEFENGVVTRPSVQRRIIAALAHCPWVVLIHGGSWYSPGTSRGQTGPVDHYIQSHYHQVRQNATYAVLETARH